MLRRAFSPPGSSRRSAQPEMPMDAAPLAHAAPAAATSLWTMLLVFVLSTFVGFQVVQNVSRLLHTPLMSLTNAISAIAIVASILIAGEELTRTSTILGAIAVGASMTNIVSGFLITDRMLKMFKEREPRK
jgi:NAD(P) transhydrogenase subunit alpha